MASLLESGDVVRLVSNKVPKQPPPKDTLVVKPDSGDVISCGRPSNDLKYREFVVTVNKNGTIQFKNNEAGGFLASDSKTLSVFVGNPAKEEEIQWTLLNTADNRDTVPATSLRKVWLQNVATGGFLSVRDGEGWTYSGKLWTRDDQGRPAGAYSWECFDIQVMTPHAAGNDDSVESLRKVIESKNKQIELLKHEVEELKEFKQAFVAMKQALNKV